MPLRNQKSGTFCAVVLSLAAVQAHALELVSDRASAVIVALDPAAFHENCPSHMRPVRIDLTAEGSKSVRAADHFFDKPKVATSVLTRRGNALSSKTVAPKSGTSDVAGDMDAAGAADDGLPRKTLRVRDAARKFQFSGAFFACQDAMSFRIADGTIQASGDMGNYSFMFKETLAQFTERRGATIWATYETEALRLGPSGKSAFTDKTAKLAARGGVAGEKVLGILTLRTDDFTLSFKPVVSGVAPLEEHTSVFLEAVVLDGSDI